jgi:NAD-dependent deacetylase
MTGVDRSTLGRAAALVAGAERLVVLTGAGISTASGIPDYRGPDGVWTKRPEAMRLVTIGPYMADPRVRVEAWQERLRHPAWTASPNAGHRALVELERAGSLRTLITQNVDGLHQAAGSDPERVLELHGTIHIARCYGCGTRTPMREQLERVEAGEPDPHCRTCGGIQRSATVAFGEQLDPAVLAAAGEAAAACDLFLAVGTSLTVMPAAGLCGIAHRSGAELVIVNAEPTPYDDLAAAVLRDPIDEVLPAIAGAPRTGLA